MRIPDSTVPAAFACRCDGWRRWLGWVCSLVCLAGLLAAQPRTPNVVFFLADDLGLADIGSFGAKDIRTPHLDRLAREGVRFTNFYSNGQECSPTRTAFLTARYQQRVGGLECAIGTGNVGRYDDAVRLRASNDLGLPVAETSLARMLKGAGYDTAIFGKWHLGYEAKFAPHLHGFDRAIYCIGGGMDYFHHVEDPPENAPALFEQGKPLKRAGYFTDMIADDAVRWLGETGRGTARPFFLYVPFTAPHSPFQAPDEESPTPLPADSPRWNQGKAPPRVYAAMIERMDTAIGRVLAVLEERGLAGHTIVFFTSDNGGTASARPTGLRASKGTTHEGGIRTPGIVRWPGVIRAGSEFKAPALTFDFTASIARASGVAPARDRAFDGIDVLDYAARGATPPARALFWRGRRGDRTWRAVRDGDWKYVSRQDGDKTEEWLFDLGRDPAEATDLAGRQPAELARLKGLLAEWQKRVAPTR